MRHVTDDGRFQNINIVDSDGESNAIVARNRGRVAWSFRPSR